MWDRDEVERIFNRRKEILADYNKDLSDLKDESVLQQLKLLYREASTRLDSGARDDWTMREVFWVGLDLAKVCHWHGDSDGRETAPSESGRRRAR